MARLFILVLTASFVVACVPKHELEEARHAEEVCSFGLDNATAHGEALEAHLTAAQKRMTQIQADSTKENAELRAEIEELNKQLDDLEKEYDRLLRHLRRHHRSNT